MYARVQSGSWLQRPRPRMGEWAEGREVGTQRREKDHRRPGISGGTRTTRDHTNMLYAQARSLVTAQQNRRIVRQQGFCLFYGVPRASIEGAGGRDGESGGKEESRKLGNIFSTECYTDSRTGRS